MLLARQGALNDGEALARRTVDLVARTDAVNRHADSLLALAEVLRLGGRQQAFGTTVRSAVDLYEQKGNVRPRRSLEHYLQKRRSQNQ